MTYIPPATSTGMPVVTFPVTTLATPALTTVGGGIALHDADVLPLASSKLPTLRLRTTHECRPSSVRRRHQL
jgi:hypothetical protein